MEIKTTENTAMQELKQKVLDLRFEADVNGLSEFKNACNQVINRIDSLLEKERQQIIDAHLKGQQMFSDVLFTGSAKKYYETSFNKK